MDRKFDNDKFIILVEARPSIWDTSHENYANKNIKQQCWVEVAKEMLEGFEELPSVQQNDYGKELQKKWKNLRNCFARELARRKTKPSGSAKDWKTYTYFEHMSFLLKSAANKETTTSMDPTLEEQDEDDTDGNTFTGENTSTEEPQPKRRCKKQDSSTEVLQIIKGSLQRREANEKLLNEDDDRNFLLSLLGDLKKVSANRKLDVKLEILQAIRNGLLPIQNISIPSYSLAPQTYKLPTYAEFRHSVLTHHHNENQYQYSQPLMSTPLTQSHSHPFIPGPPTQSLSRQISPPSPSPATSIASSCNSEESEIIDLLGSYNN